MSSFLLSTDDLLRGRLGLDEPVPARTARLLAFLLTVLIVYGLLYGATMGTFGGIRGERALQVVYSAVKVPLLLLVTFGLSLPSFFVLNTILGVRPDFPQVLRALVATQAVLTTILASLAPFTAVWYASSADYNAALLFNAAMFGLASVAAQWMLRRAYQPLIRRNPRHRTLLRAWLIIYAFVGIQMAWVLRPFIGNPRSPRSFFREGAWGNAYVEVARIVGRALGL
jgi:hypothetical protein